MKKSKLLGWALIALANLSACTDNAGDVLAGENEIRLTSEITPSRVTSLDYQSTQIVPGQEVGITITGAKAAHKNVAWRVGEDGVLTNTGDPVFWANEDVVLVILKLSDVGMMWLLSPVCSVRMADAGTLLMRRSA